VGLCAPAALVSPVWFRWNDPDFEIVVARDDVKARHLARDARCAFVVFEAVRPFRGVEVRGSAELVDVGVEAVRREIAGRYLGREAGDAFAVARRATPGYLLRLRAHEPRVWSLAVILPG
jgi:hypothetical protein